MSAKLRATTLYGRLGGYDVIAAIADDLLERLMGDPQLGRFWQNRARDSVRREKQLLIEFLGANTGGPVYYLGRDMEAAHRGMGITESDWSVFLQHVKAALDRFAVADRERGEVLGFVHGMKKGIVEQ